MKRLLVVLLILLGATAFAQDGEDQPDSQSSLVERYISNFRNAGLETKMNILDASESEDLEEMAPLYNEALSYLVSNAADIERVTTLQQMSDFVTERLEEAAYAPAAERLWELFRNRRESRARVSMLRAVGAAGEGNEQIVVNLNQWISDQNGNAVAAGGEVDRQVLEQAVVTAGELGSPSTFPILLETRLLQFSNRISDAAEESLASLEGDTVELSIDALDGRDPGEKYEAFDYLIDSDLLTEEERPVVAQAALNQALEATVSDPTISEEIRQLRYDASEVVRQARFGEATRSMIRHFNQTVLEYERGVTTRQRVLEAVSGLGAMDTDEAAVRLTDYLELLNTYTELDRPYDSQIVMEVIANLERLGRPDSYNALFYCTLLDYPNRVKEAAREAMRAVSR
ncbi:MAG: hypothetical protein ACOC45_04980 [Alkalispirochaetaceae bacterium]